MTATTFGVDLYQKLREPQSSGEHVYASRSAHSRTSGLPPVMADDYSPQQQHLMQAYPLSRFDSSGNDNNKRIGSLHSSRFSRSNSNSERDSSTWTSSTGANNLPSGSSLLRNDPAGLRSSGGSLQSKAIEDAIEKCGDVVIEEKRRRPHGDGFTLHRYIRGRLLGKGGFAKVYLCTACDTDKQYAVKVVPKANLVKARARQKLQAEIKIHRTLKHPNVCQYKHYFEDRENCYILLELCQNQTLNEMLKRRKRLSEPETVYFLSQLLTAVRYMHDEMIIHRDLKLGNLFLGTDMTVKVGDFGLATRVEDRDEKRKTICGTPNYIAPEIIQGDKSKRGHSFEVDVWSIGVILYTLLVGKPPYEAKDVKATYQRILANEYSFPKHVDLSDRAKSLIVSLLKSDPAERPSLDQIESHSFFNDNIIPMSVPTSALCIAPQWRVTGNGELVAEKEQPDRHSTKQAALPISASGRLPFHTRDPNMAKAPPVKSTVRPEKAHNEVINVHRIASNALTMSGMGSKPQSLPPPSQTPGFTIFDESRGPRNSESRSSAASKPPPPRSSTFSDDALVSRTKTLSIASPTRTSSSIASNISSVDNDMDLLKRMVDQLETVLDITDNRVGMYRGQVPRPLSGRSGPSKWVIRYVDYTSKYGLGFLLNDGSSGVYFNDSTKAALESEGESFQYIERRKPEDVDPLNRRSENLISTHSLMSYPEALKKKVTLLTHFRNYLMEQQKRADEDESIVPSSINAIASESLVYVKKWVRTKHAILFRLSDHTVQVVFYDQTEILMTPDLRYITYVDKARYRATYAFTDELVGSWTEMGKRLKYSKEIILQLLTGQRR